MRKAGLLSRAFTILGQDQLRGYQLCVKHANERGGVLGRRIELLVEDDQSNAATAVAIYEKLITRAKVDAILGPYSSPITEAVADVTSTTRWPHPADGRAGHEPQGGPPAMALQLVKKAIVLSVRPDPEPGDVLILQKRDSSISEGHARSRSWTFLKWRLGCPGFSRNSRYAF